MENILEFLIGYPDEVPQRLFQLALSIAFALVGIQIGKKLGSNNTQQKKSKHDEEEEDSNDS